MWVLLLDIHPPPSIIIGVEGNIYEHYPNFPNRVNEALRDLYGHKVDRINLGVSEKAINGIKSPILTQILRLQEMAMELEVQ